MSTKKMIYALVLTTTLVSFSMSCSDFLDTKPLDAVSADQFFNTASDIRLYVNKFYDMLPTYKANAGVPAIYNLGRDLYSDILVYGFSIPGSLNQVSNSGVAPTTSGGWNGGYANIRQCNYVIYYAELKTEKTKQADHYRGEAYFFRAWNYFSMLQSFGDVPIVKDLLKETDIEKIYVPRSPRNEVAKFILEDLDKAIAYLDWKGEGEAVAGRVNKESALVFKQRVALYEGTWEYYHNKKNTLFKVEGKDGKDFLAEVVKAGDTLMAHQGTKLFKAGTEPYNRLFAQDDLSTVDGAFFYRVYNSSLLKLSHNFYDKIEDRAPTITNHLVDCYLKNDGNPQAVNASDYTTSYTEKLDSLGKYLDPRFRQTIWTPDRGPLAKLEGGRPASPYYRYPFVSQGVAVEFTTPTGYRNFKGAIFDLAQFRKGDTDDLLIRYAEGLLAYAEAKAILGTITQGDIDKTVNLLRDRVGMTRLDMTKIASFTYDETLGFDQSEPPIVNEIRRERTVELALEGFRMADIKRWAVFDKVVNGYKPQGALLQEFEDYFNDNTKLNADQGSNVGTVQGLPLVEGGSNANVAKFPNGRINVFFKTARFKSETEEGLYINPDRDYLSAVPRDQIQLYEANMPNIKLTQNPGWN